MRYCGRDKEHPFVLKSVNFLTGWTTLCYQNRGSDNCVAEDASHIGCHALSTGKLLQTFRKIVLPSSSKSSGRDPTGVLVFIRLFSITAVNHLKLIDWPFPLFFLRGCRRGSQNPPNQLISQINTTTSRPKSATAYEHKPVTFASQPRKAIYLRRGLISPTRLLRLRDVRLPEYYSWHFFSPIELLYMLTGYYQAFWNRKEKATWRTYTFKER